MDKEIATALAATRQFGGLSENVIQHVAAAGQRILLEPDQILFSQGDRADAAFVVISGEIYIEILSPSGRTAHIATLKHADVFGEFAILDEGDRTADARSQTKSVVFRIPQRLFLELVETSPSLASVIINDLIEKLRKTNGQIEDLTFRPLKSRLAALIIQLLRETSLESMVLNVTQAGLAERLAATREKVNVHLQSIQSAGIIKLQRGKIIILDDERLANIANQR